MNVDDQTTGKACAAQGDSVQRCSYRGHIVHSVFISPQCLNHHMYEVCEFRIAAQTPAWSIRHTPHQCSVTGRHTIYSSFYQYLSIKGVNATHTAFGT